MSSTHSADTVTGKQGAEHLPITHLEAAPRHSAAANVIDSGGKVPADSDRRRALESVIHSGFVEDTGPGQDRYVLAGCLLVARPIDSS